MPPIPKADPEARAFFQGVVPDDPDVAVRPMFGNLSAFVNGNMFMGVFGPDLFLRLPKEDRDAIAAKGGGPFEPMPGRPMRDYVLLPAGWRGQPGLVREWVARSLDLARALPPKQPKAKRAKRLG